MRGGGRLFSEPALGSTTTGDEMPDDGDDGQKQQEMDQGAGDVKGQKPKQPKHDEHGGDTKEHKPLQRTLQG